MIALIPPDSCSGLPAVVTAVITGVVTFCLQGKLDSSNDVNIPITVHRSGGRKNEHWVMVLCLRRFRQINEHYEQTDQGSYFHDSNYDHVEDKQAYARERINEGQRRVA